MKNRKNIFIEIIIITIVLIMNMTLVNAENQEHSFNINVSTDKITVKPGDEITIQIGVSDINMGDNGINTLEGMIVYDENILEEIKSDSLTAQNGWTVTYNDESSLLNGKFLAVNLSTGIKENTKLFNIKMKVKSNITKSTETNIEIKDITSNDGTDLVNIGNKNIKLNIEVPNGGQTENKNENKTQETTSNKITSTSSTQNTVSTTSKTKIPNTGTKYTIIIFIVIAIIALIILAVKSNLMKGIK